ncbi:MAG: hypothetical protein ACYC9Y_07960 [Candidatus Methylomirabilia bacterium]
MRTSSMGMPDKKGRRRILCALAVPLLLAAAASGAAQDEPKPQPAPDLGMVTQAPPVVEDRLFAGHLQAGYTGANVEDNRTFVQPYDPLESGAVLGLDLNYLSPSFGTFSLESAFRGSDDWNAALDYGRAAAVDINVQSRTFTHARAHTELPEDYEVANFAAGGLIGESHDANPGAQYADTLSDTRASVKVRVPGYPAHLSASGRVYRHQGNQQMIYFFRSCSTEVCHVKSQTRTLDQVTREYALGADAHAGPIDIVYSRTFSTFRDDARDPVAAFGDLSYTPAQSSKAGDYSHDVNPDLRSFRDEVKINTNLANRGVVSLAYTRQEQENETSGITRGDQHAALDASYLVRPLLFAVVHLNYDGERTLDLSAKARATRDKDSEFHIKNGQSHFHAVEPEYERWSGEVGLRLVPRSGAKFLLRGGYRTNKRVSVIYKTGGVWDDDPNISRTTHAALDGKWRFGRVLDLDGTLAQEWTTDPAYAIEATSLTRYGLGAAWAPDTVFSLRLGYAGYSGTNDDEAALERGYAKLAKIDEGFSRKVTGNAVNLLASLTPAPAFTLTAAYSWSDNGIEQDLRFGGPSGGTLSYVSEDTAWSGTTQVANLRAIWAATSRLKLTGEGTWVSGRESYAPDFAADADLKEFGTGEFTKLYAALGAEISVTKTLGCTLTGFWSAYDDRQDEKGDGHALGMLAAIDVRW